MTLLQRFALWLGTVCGLFPGVTVDDVEVAAAAVRASASAHKAESAEYRRHVAYKHLVDSGMAKRTAAVAIELALAIKG